MAEDDKNKFVYDVENTEIKFNDGVTTEAEKIEQNFNLYYSWVCEKVDKGSKDFKAWRETLGFLSLEKYRAYTERDKIRIRLLEFGMLKYINLAVAIEDPRISILAFRQAVQWGYPSILIHGQNGFESSTRYLRFLLKIIKRYYVRSSINRVSLEAYAGLGNFDEFLMSLLTLSLNKKIDLLAYGKERTALGKKLFYSDGTVDWTWLDDDIKNCKNSKDFKGLLNVIHFSLADYLDYGLEISSKDTLVYWGKLVESMKQSKKNWIRALYETEQMLYKQMKERHNENFNS